MAKLPSEQDTPAMERRVLRAALAYFGRWPRGTRAKNLLDYKPVFEHGQWWITQTGTGSIWSVVDAVGGNSVGGFEFERATVESHDEED